MPSNDQLPNPVLRHRIEEGRGRTSYTIATLLRLRTGTRGEDRLLVFDPYQCHSEV